MRLAGPSKFTSVVVLFTITLGLFAPAWADEPARKADGKYPFRDQYFLDLGYGTLGRDTTYEINATQYTSWKRGSIYNFKVGHRWSKGLRIEYERTQFKNDCDMNKIPIGEPTVADGYSKMTANMLNINYDWGFKRSRVAPFVGVGFGKYTVNLRGLSSDGIRGFGAFVSGGAITNASLSDDAPAENCLQWMFGVNYRLNRRVELHAQYRYFHGQDFDLEFPIIQTNITPPGPVFRAFELGIRYLF